MARPELDVDWVGARSAVESGVPMEKVAARFGIKFHTLRKKAQRQGWITPADVEKAMNQDEPGLSQSLSQASSKEARVALLAETWAEKGAKLRRVMFKKAFNAVKASTVQSPKNWRDLEIADKLARRAAGLDTADNQVNLSFSVPGWGHGTKVYDVDSGAYSVPSSEEETQSPPTAIEDSGGD